MQILLWVGVLSLLSAAAAMGVVAWRVARGARERESARVELLRALAFPDVSAVPESGPSIADRAEFLSEQWTAPAPAVDTYEPAASIFADRAEPVAALPRWVSLAGVGAVMALGVMLYVVLAGGPRRASVTTTAAPDRPIELIALQHRFDAATGLEVSGVVRNPAEGRELPQLVAVVNLVDAGGRILTSQTTPVERPVLEAGQTSAFSLVVPQMTGTAARFQVRFRLQGRDVVPHVDRRAPETGGKASSS